MKITELRIGNLVNHTIEGLTVVDKIEKDKVNDFDLSYFYWIPVNENWLKKFGFTKTTSESEDYFTSSETKINCMNAIFDRGRLFLCSIDSRLCTLGIEIKYVHSLQNLFFALTGEELTLTNP